MNLTAAQPPRNGPALDANVAIPQTVVYRSFATETVVLNLDTGKYHGVNPTAGRIIEVLDKTGSPREAARVIADEFGQPLAEVEQDVVEFCADLADRGLIVIDGYPQG